MLPSSRFPTSLRIAGGDRPAIYKPPKSVSDGGDPDPRDQRIGHDHRMLPDIPDWA